MNSNRRKLYEASLLDEYETILKTGRLDRLRAILTKAKFSEIEIESILWAKGGLGPELPEETKSDRIVGVIGQTVISAIVVGFMTAYYWGGFSGSFSSSTKQRSRTQERVMTDYRTPYEAYYRPFIIGCCVGAALPHAYRLIRKRRRA